MGKEGPSYTYNTGSKAPYWERLARQISILTLLSQHGKGLKIERGTDMEPWLGSPGDCQIFAGREIELVALNERGREGCLI